MHHLYLNPGDIVFVVFVVGLSAGYRLLHRQGPGHPGGAPTDGRCAVELEEHDSMSESKSADPVITRNKHCLEDGKPCVPAGDGGCMACDDSQGNYNQEPVDCNDWPAPYTALDFLVDSLEQVRQMEAARHQVHAQFEADQKRIEEWKL
jgi:hypothetical protein